MILNRTRAFLIGLPRFAKKLLVVCSDVLLVFVSTWASFCLRFEHLVSLSEPLLLAAVASIFIGLPIFIILGFYRAIFRFIGWHTTIDLIKSFLIYLAVYVFIFTVIGVGVVPRSIGLLQPAILFLFIGGSRVLANIFLNYQLIGGRKLKSSTIALIYGAGAAGRQLASGLMQGVEVLPIAFVDDDPRFWKSTINGLRVYPPDKIESLVSAKVGITDVLLAMPSVMRARQREILSKLSNLPVHVRTLPGLADLANGVVQVEDVREVEIEDVLSRDPVQANENLLRQNITGKVVLVTGAGGSIGSELCRQILTQQPSMLILFELSEFALYTIERELGLLKSTVTIVPVLGSVLESSVLSRLFQRFEVNVVFHAAAYKHVPLIEINSAAGIWNNVFGTLRTVEAACKSGVDVFVLVSTDKAVRPTNVMGCTKRLAEMILQAKNLQGKQFGIRIPKLTMVRFGNVLGSSGSVVPVFREQIKNGGPVTVTHPEIIRYFMTIPEAAQLVIQAGAMGEGGDVMVLDMGEPVKIVDLAKRMIHLSGFSHKDESNPDGDIEIQFSGLRPGEKLYEELLIGDNTLPTSHARIMRASEHALRWDELEPLLFELEAAAKAENSDAIRSLLKKAVPEFKPQSANGDVLLG